MMPVVVIPSYSVSLLTAWMSPAMRLERLERGIQVGRSPSRWAQTPQEPHGTQPRATATRRVGAEPRRAGVSPGAQAQSPRRTGAKPAASTPQTPQAEPQPHLSAAPVKTPRRDTPNLPG